MSNTWKYKVDLKADSEFSKIEKRLNVVIPKSLKKLIAEANGASPEKNCIKINDVEKVFAAVLSFNENEQEADDVYTAILAINNNNYIPFGIDPFGNYYCVSVKTETVVFWSHEENLMTDTKMNVKDFINALY